MRNIFQLCGNPGNLADKLPVSLPCVQERKNNHWTIIMPTEPWLLISVTEFEHLLSISGTWSFYITYLSPEQFRITASGKKKISPRTPWLASQQKRLKARIRGYLQSQTIVLFFKKKLSCTKIEIAIILRLLWELKQWFVTWEWLAQLQLYSFLDRTGEKQFKRSQCRAHTMFLSVASQTQARC